VHMARFRETPLTNEKNIKTWADSDEFKYGRCMVRMEEEPGSGGKNTISHYALNILPGYDFKGVKHTGSKADRARPFAAACERGDVFIVEGNWNIRDMLDELCSFPSGDHDDQVDALSGAFMDLKLSDLLPDDAAVFNIG